MLRFPPLTPAVRALLIALGCLFVLEAVLQNFLGVPVFQLLSLTTTRISPATAWQLLTHVFVVPPVPGIVFSLAISLAFIWLILAPFEARYGQTKVVQLAAVAAVSAGVPALLVGQLLPSMAGNLSGPETITLAAIAGYAVMLPPQAEVSFFGLFPMRAQHLILVVIGLSVLGFLTSRDAAQLAADCGAIAGGISFCKWMQRAPRKAKRAPGVRGGGRLHAVKGGAGGDKDPKRWLN
ncbi:MAG: rhomboid family intramembrane serine protease [Myxococcales bacterium]